MNCLITYVKLRGYQPMRLLAAVNNIAANRLYTRMGFACLGVVQLYEKSFNAYVSIGTTSCTVFSRISNRANSHDIVRYFV